MIWESKYAHYLDKFKSMNKAEIPKIHRALYWQELTPDQKIEALAELVEMLVRRQTEMREDLKKLRLHAHLSDHSIVYKSDPRGFLEAPRDENPLRRKRSF